MHPLPKRRWREAERIVRPTPHRLGCLVACRWFEIDVVAIDPAQLIPLWLPLWTPIRVLADTPAERGLARMHPV